MGAQTLGIDASASNIAIAQSHAAADPKLASTLSYLYAPAESLLSEPKRYDVVCSMEVIEHVDNPVSFLETCAELVKVFVIFFSFLAYIKTRHTAWRPSIPLHYQPHSLVLRSHYPSCGTCSSYGHTRDTHTLQIY